MAFDNTNTATSCRPGERLVAGRVYVFNADLLNAHLADERLSEGLPSDLSTVSDFALHCAFYAYLNVHARRRGDAEVEAFGTVVCNERAQRQQKAAA